MVGSLACVPLYISFAIRIKRNRGAVAREGALSTRDGGGGQGQDQSYYGVTAELLQVRMMMTSPLVVP